VALYPGLYAGTASGISKIGTTEVSAFYLDNVAKSNIFVGFTTPNDWAPTTSIQAVAYITNGQHTDNGTMVIGFGYVSVPTNGYLPSTPIVPVYKSYTYVNSIAYFNLLMEFDTNTFTPASTDSRYLLTLWRTGAGNTYGKEVWVTGFDVLYWANALV
jgi:hypothetical protein